MAFYHNLIAPFLKMGINYVSRRRLPTTDGKLDIYGIREEVSISRDKWGVPHITATNDYDLFFAQGFVHAQDRLWQMDLNRRTAKGTLSEVFGKVALDTDRLSRTLGFHRLGKKDWEQASEEVKNVINAYVNGINAFINHLDTSYPVEYSLAGFKPKIWDHEDCLAFSRLMIWQLSHAWFGEIVRSKIIDAVGKEHAAELEIHYPPTSPVQLPEGIEFNKLVKGKLKKTKGPFLDQNMGSNAWVVSAERSETGSPILANDMHLTQKNPSLWYNNHLKSDDLNMTGVSIPGLPMVLIGHNGNIAWGATLSFNDCEDLFVEKFNPDNEKEYVFNGSKKEATIIRDLIDIKDDYTHQEKIFITEHGPIISSFIEGQKDKVALQSKSLQPVPSLEGWYLLNTASGWDDFVSAMKLIEAPSLNFVYADEKNIGYYCSGRVPVRKKGNGKVPVPGWDGKYEWSGEIPFEEMPHAFNPERGYIITCNNKLVDDSYPHYLGENTMNGYRAQRLEEYFQENEKISLELCKQMQLDFTCKPALEFTKHYEGLESESLPPTVSIALDFMKKWDGVLTADSIGGTIYSVTKYMAVRELLEQHLGPVLTDIYSGKGFHPILLPSHEFYGHDTVVLLRILEQEQESWWLEHAGGKEKLLEQSLIRAVNWLMANYGQNVKKWKWGKIHQIEFEHTLSIQPPLDKVFNRGPYPVGGDTDTPNQMAIVPQDPFGAKSWVPSWRQIIDLDDITKSIASYAPGQSGQVASDHYDDLIKLWLNGEYYSLLWTRGQVEMNQKGLLTLNPLF